MSNERPQNPNSSTLTEGLKKKRGRPKKQPQEDGGNTAVIPQDAVEPQPVKKPRGRPKGNKKASGLTGGTAKPSAGKRQRGRPRKWPQAVVQGESEGGNSLESSDWNLNSAPAAQVSSGAPAPVSLPATALCAAIGRAAGSQGMSSPPAQPPPPLVQLHITQTTATEGTFFLSVHHWKRWFQVQQNHWS